MNTGFFTLADLSDDIHPNEGGYRKMAAVWYDAIEKIEDRIEQPVNRAGRRSDAEKPLL
jgi:hypothetical protein